MEAILLSPWVLLIIIVIFLLTREFWTWYFKINEIVSGQKQTNILLQKLVNEQVNERSQEEIKGDVVVQDTETNEIIGMSNEEWHKILSESPKQKKFKRMQ